MIVGRLAFEHPDPGLVERSFRDLPLALERYDAFTRLAAIDRSDLGYLLEAYRSASDLNVVSRLDPDAKVHLVYLSGQIGAVHGLALGIRYGTRGRSSSWSDPEFQHMVRAPDARELFFLAEREDPSAYRLAR